MVRYFILFLMCFALRSEAEEQQRNTDKSIYTPVCFSTKSMDCKHEDEKNLVFIGTGLGIINHQTQNLYSFGYFRRVPTMGSSLYLGGSINGSQVGLYGWNFLIGAGF